MNTEKIMCYIHNNIILNIFNNTIGTKYEKEERVSLTELLFGLPYSIITLILFSWWLIPLKYIVNKFFAYSDNKYFTCKDIGEK